MESGKILSSAIAGTSAMTLFSYVISQAEKKNFREPEILSQLIERFPKGLSKTPADIAGWCTHYGIGILFVIIYNEWWKEEKIKPSLTSGALMGTISGLVDIAGWQTMFEIHPDPPPKNLKKYYGHLIIAHIIFGIFSAITYKLIVTHKTRE